MRHYPHHIGDFNNATRHLTRLERSIYRDLLDLYYDTESRLPLDLDVVCRKILARSNEESTAVEQVLNEFFIMSDEGWYHERCEKEINTYRTIVSQKSAAGRASAAKRADDALRKSNIRSTGVQHLSNGCSTNQEPRTKNQEPSKEAQAPLPDWIDKEAWEGYAEMRKKQRKPMTDRAKQMVLKKLDEMRSSGIDYVSALNKSTQNCWTDVYPPKAGEAPAQQTTFV